MNPFKVSAQFAAYTWFTNNSSRTPTAEEAVLFARRNWAAFLPCAHEGLGRLLIRIAGPRPQQGKHHGQPRAKRMRLAKRVAG
jgi:hypothetical protein